MNYVYRMARAFRRAVRFDLLDTTQFMSGLGDSTWLLYGLVRALKPEICVEIGAARGKSACYIGLALRENGRGKLYSIDPHTVTDWNDTESVDTNNLFMKNIHLLGLEQFVQAIRDFSENVGRTWTLPISILFIDGDHSYEGVKRDWDLFSPFVTPFGLVVFHDTLWDMRPDPHYARPPQIGVPRFVEELRQQGYPLITFDKNFGTTLVQPIRGGILLSGQ